MLSVALLSLLVPTAGAVEATASAVLAQQSDLPVQVWLSKRDVRLGDRVRAYTRVATDGYLLVLHAEPDGRVRVLFPVDPIEDNFIRGGSEFEIRGRGDREAFSIYASSGVGTVYAAFSRDPFRFDEFVRNGHWDYGLPDTWVVFDDAEADLTDIAATMASGAYFDYDMTQYGVGEVVAQTSSHALHYYGGTYVNVGAYYPSYYHDPWYGYGYPYGWGFGVGFGWGGWGFSVGWGGYWGYPYRYGYGYGYGYGYPCCYYGPGYPSPYYYATPYHGGYGYPSYGYASRRVRYTPQFTPSNAAGRSRRVNASSAGLGSRRLASSNGTSQTGPGVGNAARRASPSSGTVDAAGRRASSTGRTISAADRRTSPTNRTVNTAPRRTISPVVRSPGTSSRSASTSTRRSFPQQPARTTPVSRQATDAADRRSVGSTNPTAGGERQSTARRVTPSSATTTRSTSQGTVSPVRRSTSSSTAQARPVRQTTSRSPVTSTRRTTTTSQSRPATTTARPRTTSSSSRQPTLQRRVTPSAGSRAQPTRPSMSAPRRAPTRVTAPKVIRPSSAGSRGSVRPSSGGRTTAKVTTRRRP